MYDVIIRNGRVYDGTGAPWLRADLGVKDGKIATVGVIECCDAKRVIDATGLAVSPGFIDTHTHSDLSFLVDPCADSKIKQGVTLEVSGNCGGSDAPVTEKSRAQTEKGLKEVGLELTWTSFGQYLERVEARGTSVNWMCLVGHGTIRNGVMGYDKRPPTPEELEKMKALVAQAMDEGAIGMSTGLLYAPGSFADTAEVIELAKVAAAKNGYYFSHIRSSDDGLIESVAEAIEIGEKGGLPAHLAHHKATGRRNWGKVGQTFEMMEKARQRGVDITADQYPYTASSSSLASTLRTWVHEGGRNATLARLKDPDTRARIKKEFTEDIEMLAGWKGYFIARVGSEKNKKHEGRNLADIAAELGKDPCDAAIDLMIEENLDVGRVRFGMCEEDVQTVMKSPLVMVGSDGSSLKDRGPLRSGVPHPRSFGTFPRVLGKYVREEKVLTLQEALRKMTSLPAWRLGLSDRGILRPGMCADITIFNPDTVKDGAGFGDPFKYPVGIPYVLVNGQIIVDMGEHTGVVAGKVLRRRA
jgi:N-acyl-D-amino-acid deacylase